MRIHEIMSLQTCKIQAINNNWSPRKLMIPQYVVKDMLVFTVVVITKMKFIVRKKK